MLKKSRSWALISPTAILSLLLIGCFGLTAITGRYRNEPSRDVSDVKVQSSLNDLKGNERHYFVRLRPDGSFHFRVPLSGQYLLSAYVAEYSRDKWRSPSLSSDTDFCLIQIPPSGNVQLGTYYISDEIQIQSPANQQAVSISGDFEFEWVTTPMTQYYSISLYDWDKSGERSPVITAFNIVNSGVRFSEIQRMEKVTGELGFPSIKQKGTFVRQGQELTPGKYGLGIRAYSVDEESSRFINVARSASEWTIPLTK